MAEGADGQPITTFSVAELLAAKLEPETGEHAYRRGYRDGWVQAVDAMHDLMFADRLTRQAAYDRCWDHWQKALHPWVRACKGDESGVNPANWPPAVERGKEL